MKMQLGVNLPFSDIGTGPSSCATMRRRPRVGFRFLVCPDHVLNADPAKAPAGSRAGGYASPSGSVRALRLSFGPDEEDRLRLGRPHPGATPGGAGRQAAACLDELSGGRFRSASASAGTRSNSKARHGLPHPRPALRRAGPVHAGAVANPSINFKGKYHQLTDGGINPRPKSGKVPCGFGGHAEQTLERVAK